MDKSPAQCEFHKLGCLPQLQQMAICNFRKAKREGNAKNAKCWAALYLSAVSAIVTHFYVVQPRSFSIWARCFEFLDRRCPSIQNLGELVPPGTRLRLPKKERILAIPKVSKQARLLQRQRAV